MVRLLESGLQVARQSHHLTKGFGSQAIQTCDVLIRRNHGVTAVIREQIQDDQIESAAVKDQPLTILRWIAGSHVAENAALALGGAAHVLVTPGAPDVIHVYRARSACGWTATREERRIEPGIPGG